MITAVEAPLLLANSLQVAAWWRPHPNTTWQIVLSAPLTPPYISPPPHSAAPVIALDGDLFDNASNNTWPTIKKSGYKTLCYFSAGSYEGWRPDASSFLPADLGNPLDGWPGEKWLDTRSGNVRAIMRKRLDLAVEQGCDGADPDNIDAYDNDGGGLNLTASDAVDYVRFLAQEAHGRALAVGLKNGGAIVADVINVTDFQVNEQFVEYDECEAFQPFVDAGKPVFGIEYTKRDCDMPGRNSSFVQDTCRKPNGRGFSTLVKHENLDEWVVACGDAGANTTSVSMETASTSGASARAADWPGIPGDGGMVVAGGVVTLLYLLGHVGGFEAFCLVSRTLNNNGIAYGSGLFSSVDHKPVHFETWRALHGIQHAKLQYSRHDIN